MAERSKPMTGNRFVMPNGKHEGTPIARVPIDYLKWMVNVDHTFAEIAEAEMERRGTPTPELDISAHSIDRASLRFLKKWQETASENEGIASWLARVAAAAWKHQAAHGGLDGEACDYAGIRFVFDSSGRWPILKTVTHAKRRKRAKGERNGETNDGNDRGGGSRPRDDDRVR